MKKLMFIAAVMTAGMCLSDIVSANVVGYQTKQTVAGQNFLAPTFKNVSDKPISVQDIKLSGDAVIEYVDSFCILDEYGNPKDGMTFFWTSAGWVTDLQEPAVLTINPGEGIVIYTMQADVGITFSGEVRSQDLALVSIAGQNWVGNASPIEISVQDITLSGSSVIEYVDSICLLDEYGNPKDGTTFFWTSAGWVTDLQEPAVLNLAPGEGAVVYTLQEGVNISLPGVAL